MYKILGILGYYRGIPKQFRSKLFDVLWVDGSAFGPLSWGLADACGLPGVMYFVFMLREPIYPYVLDLNDVDHCAHSSGYSERRIGATSPGMPSPDSHGNCLADVKGSAIASWWYTVSLRTYVTSAKVIFCC